MNQKTRRHLIAWWATMVIAGGLVLWICGPLGCQPTSTIETKPEDEENALPRIGEKLSHNYTRFKIIEANEKWTKYQICNGSTCSCGSDNFRYFVTCRNGNDEVLSIWSDCQ